MIKKVVPGDDFGSISKIYAHTWKAAYKDIIPSDYLASLDDNNWCEVLKSQSLESLVFTKDDVYVGTCGYCPAREEAFDGWGEIVSLYVLPQYWGGGLGSKLIEQAQNYLKAQGFEKIYLLVLEENINAQKFYKKHGFKPLLPAGETEIGGKKLGEIRFVKTLS